MDDYLARSWNSRAAGGYGIARKPLPSGSLWEREIP